MSQLRDEAEALAEGLEIGACDVEEVIAWSDAQLLRDNSPPGILCEVSLSHDRYPQDVASLLRQYPGAPDRPRVERLLVTLVDAKLKGDPSRAYQIASALYQLALADKIEDSPLQRISSWAWDAFDLADAGFIEESREQVINQMAAALHDAATEAEITWSVGGGSLGADSP